MRGAAALRAAGRAGERFHRFTMDDERLREGLRGTFADLRPYSPDGGGPIAGGMFLREFVKPGVPWAHLDIAGSAFKGSTPKGGTGRPVGLLLEFFRNKVA